MNTNLIKSFAKQARINLIDAVVTQLKFWGFDEKGNVLHQPETVSGGFMFRSNLYNDTTLVPKWEKLKTKITDDKLGFKDVSEEAAYTWFNRLMALKVLEQNGFIDHVLHYQEGSKSPQILQNAKAGNHQITHSGRIADLQKALQENDDEKAFGILLINLCNKNPLLREIFGKLDDYTELLLPQNLLATNGFIALLNDGVMEDADYLHVELIGWLYQFYISDKKDEVFKGFKANKKARPEDIPAATQIFTPKWIVNYMVENTVGKIYLDFEEDSELKDQMKYLVANETDGKGTLITDIKQLTLIDPACGSGHILVTGFEWLYKMYREQGYGAKQTVENILQHNLYGLDIDDRAMQLARFAVLLKAAQQLESVGAGQGRELLNQPLEVIPHIYAFPEIENFTAEEVSLFTTDQNVAEVLKAFTDLRQGKNIGTALKITLSENARTVLIDQFFSWKAKAEAGTLNIEEVGIWAKLKTYIEVALVLTKKYRAVVANPPYMGQKSMNGELKDYVNKHYPMTKSDLFAVFMEVCLALSLEKGLMGMINQHSWMFLSSFEKYREYLLLNYIIDSMLHLGPRTFEELSGEVVQSTAFVLENKRDKKAKGNYYRLVDYKSNNKKEEQFLAHTNFHPNIPQTNFEKITGSPIAYWVSKKIHKIFQENKNLANFSSPRKGNSTSDNNRFLRFWYEVNFNKNAINYFDISEVNRNEKRWIPYNKGGGTRKWFGYNENMIDWKDNANEIREIPTSVITNEKYYMEPGLTWSTISPSGFAVRYFDEGFIFDNGGCCLFDLQEKRDYFAGLLNSKVFTKLLGLLNPTLNFQSGEVSKFPVIESELYNGHHSKINFNISKKDWDSHETSWDFEQNTLLAQKQNSLANSYQSWKEKVSQDFFQLHKNEEELNRIFIDIYGLQDELTPEVALKDITILQDELKAEDLEMLEPAFRAGETVELPIQKEMVMSQFLSYLVGLTLGRYRLDRPGLHIAHPNPTDEEIAAYRVENVALPFSLEIDEDAIIPLMGSACSFPDDAVKRIEDLVYRIYGEETLNENLNFINDCLGTTLEKWMTEKFWSYHISGKVYKKKPIYWLFCSNPKSPQKSAFRVLVYMHRMDQYTVQKVMRNYLHPHQEHLRTQFEQMHANEAQLDKQELKVFENLQKQISELKSYNEVLKELAAQQITFDLDDGVSVNYEKFVGAVAEIK